MQPKSNQSNKYLPFALLLAALAGPAAAQAAAQSQAAPAQRALLNSAQFVDAAIGIVRSVEANQAPAIWDSASSVMKAALPKERFMTTIRARILASGPFIPQDWYTVTRTRVAPQTPNVPPGDYLSVGLIGTNKSGTPIRTTISFHLDSDNNWRLAGYSVP